ISVGFSLFLLVHIILAHTGVLKNYSGTDAHVLVPDEVKVIGDGAFKKNKLLISITLPEHLSAIGHYAFKKCINLTSIEIPESVTVIGDFAFKGCKKLPFLDIPQSVRRIGRGACDFTLLVIH
ncbi:MAG TPA: leucine-rich repeat domain-containing protein, partial [Ruminococcus sp.]|nr:leucine-rich repeat domain-containing protein [Ruminococcus sp.]